MSKKIANGFYRTCYSSRMPRIILIFYGEHEIHPAHGPITSEWEGIVYKYFDFNDEKVYKFNEHWVEYIDSLTPIIMKESEIEAINNKFQKKLAECEKEQSNLSQICESIAPASTGTEQ